MKYAANLILGAALAAPLGAGAANFDGVAPVLCATLGAVQCVKEPGTPHICARGDAQALSLPQFIRIDFAKKHITATREAGVDKSSTFGDVARGNGHLILQGVDGGRAWSLVMEENTGVMTGSAIGDEEGMMIYGACTQI